MAVVEQEPEALDGEESTEQLDPTRAAEILDTLGLTLAETRSKAISGRKSSGIEEEWEEDEEHYEGVDDVNRGEAAAWRTKPPGQQFTGDKPTASTAFLNITRPYCDAAGARCGDMLLPTDDRAFSIDATPVVDDMVSIAKGDIPPRIVRQIEEDPRLQKDGNGNALPDEQRQQLVGKTKDDLVASTKQELDEAKAKAKKAEKRIDDWHVESNFHGEMRAVIEDAAKMGTGVLKGPVPEYKRTVAYMDGKLVVDREIKPVSRRISYWNLFPDYPACGENIHRGNFVFERDDITRRELEDLLGTDYIDHQIMAVLEEGPHKADFKFDVHDERPGLSERDEPNLFEIWYYYGRLEKEQLEAAGCECEEGEKLDVLITMVNNRVIKAVLNPLDNGDFPYDIMIWQKRTGMPWGIGVARQIRVPQRVVNAAFRNMMDNAGIAGGPMWAFMQGIIAPLNGKYEIAPRKGWKVLEGATLEDVDRAFKFYTVDMMVEELQAIIQLGLKFAEDVTGMPMLLQGQTGENAPDTLGGQILMTNNSSTVLRRIARLSDDRITEPHIRRYYAYLLQYGEDEEKGDFQIDARGSSALVEREIQNQAILQLGNLTTNPIYGIDPKKWSEEMLKSQRLDPKRFQFDDEQWQKTVEGLMKAAQQPDSRLQVAELNAQLKQAEWKHDAQQAEAEREFETRQAEIKRQTDIFFKELEAENKALEAQGKQQLTVAQIQAKYQEAQQKIKADLAQTAMKLRVQKELSGTQAVTPAVEPKGRAPEGQAFQR